MTKDEFWEHIRATRRLDPDEHTERLAVRLAKLPAKEILSFGRWWETLDAKGYTWKLWGAAYLINGGCSDDGFDYFRWWLMLRGRAVYEAALKNPDSLAAVLKGEGEVEAGSNPANDAYSAATGREDYYEALKAQYPKLKFALPDLGDGWDFDDDAQMRRRYPKLFAAYSGGETD
jgi:hypothetical protein